MSTTGPVAVRRATTRDLDTVIRLRLALLREYREHPVYGRLRPNAERLARPIFAAQLDAPNETTFLAEAGDTPIGIIRCVETIASPLLVPERYCYISSAYVLPAHRRTGVLRALFARASDWCRERGLTEMRLHNVGSSTAAAAAWESLDFEVVEQVRMRRVPASRRVAAADAAADAAEATPDLRL